MGVCASCLQGEAVGALKMEDGGEGVSAAHLHGHLLAAVIVIQHRRGCRPIGTRVRLHPLHMHGASACTDT